MTERPLGAQISTMLADRGVEVIFGIPGVHNIELYRGLEASGVRHVLARHEQGAAFMADGYARATGKPGVAYVITGPGLTNAMTAMGQAYSDSVPLLVISSCLNRADLGMGRGRLHEMNDQEIAGGMVSDWSRTAMDAQSAYDLIDRALREFQTGRARTKHIQIPIEVLGASAPPPLPASSLFVAEAAVGDDVLKRVVAAKRPLFVFGGGARHCADEARSVTDRLGAASFMTYAGRGIIAPDAPLSYGSYLGRPESEAVIASADVVVAIGTELSETDLWRDGLGHTGLLIRVDLDPAELSDPGALNVLCDAKAFLRALDLYSEGHATQTSWQATEVSAARRRWRAETDAERPHVMPVAEALRDILPDDAMIFSDMTQFAYVAKEIWDMPAPGLWHHPCGFGTLGYALPAAIGGKIGAGDQPVLAIAGDYGFQYTLQELGTVAELGLSLPILLWDNGLLKEIEGSMEASQIAPVAIKAQNPDFGLLAQAYGLGYVRPADLKGFQEAVLAALRAQGPTLIHMTPQMAG